MSNEERPNDDPARVIRLMEALGREPAHEMACRPAGSEHLRKLMMRCARCTHPDQCDARLQHRQLLAVDDVPEFCMNRDVLGA